LTHFKQKAAEAQSDVHATQWLPISRRRNVPRAPYQWRAD
jgi:hypothetical protein